MRNVLSTVCVLALASSATAQDDAGPWVIRADRVYTAAGEVFEGGFVAVANGKIVGVGPGGGGAGDELEAVCVTPGMVDLGARVVTHPDAVEQSTEVAASMRVAHALDLFDPRWKRELESGVTTVLATPPDSNVIGGLCIAVKTGGLTDVASRTVRADVALRGSFGTQPSQGNQSSSGTPQTFYVRRPTTRMGVEWTIRKAFYDALAGAQDPERDFEGADVLRRVLDGELVLGAQAWSTQDIRTAIYVKEEFGIERMFVDAAAEAWKEPDLLVRSGMAVVLPPLSFDGRVGPENAFFSWHSARELDELGVPFALSGHGAADPAARLAYQGGLAMRGGLSLEAALAAVTLAPARMIGIDDRVGSLEVGKDADLLLWSGTPFQPTSRIIGVMLDGRLVVDRREASE